MNKEFTNPDTLPPPRGYTHVVGARPGKIVFLSGQVALDAEGKVIGEGDLRAQTETTYSHVGAGLAAVGASFGDLVKITTYVVDLTPDRRQVIADVRSNYLPRQNPPASTMVGVSALAVPGLLIEVEVVAILD
jgi:enamine deaminase RidA (YjgF/YER057c/UK114 family)